VKKSLRILLAFLGLLALGEIADLFWLSKVRATISSSITLVTVAGTGSATVFNFPFVGVANSDITVIYIDANGNQTVLVQGTQYLVSLNAPTPGSIWGIGGTVTYPLTGSPIAIGTSLTIERTLPYLQTVSSNQGQLFPTAVEAALDLIDMQVQQVYQLYGHVIATPVNDTCAVLGTLPIASQRASQVIGFDSTGCNPIALQPSSAPVSSAMQPVVAAASIAAAQVLLGITPPSTAYNVPVGTEVDWPGLIAPTNWLLENGAAISRTTYSSLLGVIAPVVSCSIASGSATITGISSTVGWGTGWIIESPGSSAIASGQTIASVSTHSITITGGNASLNATSCQIFPYSTAQDGTFYVPNAPGVAYVGIDTGNTNLNATYCTGNPAYLNAACGAQDFTILQANLPNVNFTVSGITLNDPGHSHAGVGGSYFMSSLSGTLNSPTSGTDVALKLFTNSATTGITISSQGVAASGGSGTAFSTLPPLQIRNKIIFAGPT